MKFFIILLSGLLFSCQDNSERKVHVELNEPVFEIVLEKVLVSKFDFRTLDGNESISMNYWFGSPKTAIKYGENSLLITYEGEKTRKIHLRHKNEVKTITFEINGEPAFYSDGYIKKNSGKVNVEIPEVFELNNIVLTLLEKFHGGKQNTRIEGRYYKDVIDWFSAYKEHELFSVLQDVDYHSFVENGSAYKFGSDGIRNSGEYTNFRVKDLVAEHRSLLEDFAKKSNYRAFYNRQRNYYSYLIDEFRKQTQAKNIWLWLEGQFPHRNHSYKIFFSPLGVGSHSARKFESNGFSEAVIFISGPNRYNEEGESSAIKAAKLTRSFFTEIDHTYVNPVSDLHIEEINAAFNDITQWYKGGGYNYPYLIFNEYVTWALFSVYAMENYSANDYQYMKGYIEKFMTEKRGFYKFSNFNNAFTDLYLKKGERETVADLFPKIISWIESQN